MLNKEKIIKMSVILTVFVLLTTAGQAYAWQGRSRPTNRDDHRSNNYGQRHYPAYGRISLSLPSGFFTFTVGKSKFYYSSGIYYQRQPFHYVVVPPPSGAVIRGLPVGYQPVIMNGITYYTYDGIYYQLTPQGYMVVSPPVLTVVPQTNVIVQGAANAVNEWQGDNESLTINIPNSQGNYTAVTLKRAANGFIGPQGEFYAEFPKIAQLRTMYGK